MEPPAFSPAGAPIHQFSIADAILNRRSQMSSALASLSKPALE
jgi:hypothetical protein